MRLREFCLAIVLLLAFVEFTVSVNPPESSPPSPAPTSDDDAHSPSAPVPSPGGPAPANGPVASSPPAPPAGAPAPASSQAPSPPPFADKPPVPSPAPSNASDINHSDVNAHGGETEHSSGEGMSGGKKAGIAVGVIAAAVMVGIGGVVYKKRQENMRRSQYSYTARREIL